MYKKKKNPKLFLITILGLILIIGTNLIHGWSSGIAGSISQDITQGAELYSDAIQISNLFTFISEYESLQPSLGVHSKTHPPGAIITIYLLYIVFRDPGLIAIALCVIATLTSVYFLNGIFKRFFDEKLSKYMIFLFLLLPAIQVYYLANIYAIVASLVLGVVFFYFHPNRKKCVIGSIICFFLGLFITFTFIFVGLFLLIFELLNTRRQCILEKTEIRENGIIDFMKRLVKNSQNLIIISIGVGLILGLIYLIFGFNYVNSFLFATESENQGGLTILTNPTKYLFTRIGDILDILIFFGPVLIVLCYRGFKVLREESPMKETSSQIYLLSFSAIIALLLLFIAGAFDHGETARGCMYIYPFLLLPIATYLKKENFSQIEKNKLLIIVFVQTIIMQLVGFYVW